MRLWHKDLLPYLPRQQLLGQWRECCAIAREIRINGFPNHILVNKIMNYPLCHFYSYSKYVAHEMSERGYIIHQKSWRNFVKDLYLSLNDNPKDHNTMQRYFEMMAVPYEEIFRHWHNERYLRQCYFNLEEKFYCGGIELLEWNMIFDKFNYLNKGEK